MSPVGTNENRPASIAGKRSAKITSIIHSSLRDSLFYSSLLPAVPAGLFSFARSGNSSDVLLMQVRLLSFARSGNPIRRPSSVVRRLFSAALLLLFIASTSLADTIVLKDGRKIRCDAAREEEKVVRYWIGDSVLSVARDKVDRIDRDS